MSYVSQTDIGPDVVLERLDEPQDSSFLFDVPNPESDIDMDVTQEECERVFQSNLKRLSEMAAAIG